MLQWWSEFRSTFAKESTSYKSMIWSHDCSIRINGNPIYYHSNVKAGVIIVSDLMFTINNIESFRIAKQNVFFNKVTNTGYSGYTPALLTRLIDGVVVQVVRALMT